MKLKMAENSLFAILLRKPWWISFLIAAVLALGAAAMLPKHLAAYGISAGLPFLVIGVIAFVRQMRAPSAAQIAAARETVAAMSWRDFSGAVEAAFRRDGYDVARHAGTAADFLLARGGRTALVSCKRWKAASNGIEPLRELHAAAEASDASESIFITAGQLTDNARRFADEKKIRVVQDAGLARLFSGLMQKR